MSRNNSLSLSRFRFFTLLLMFTLSLTFSSCNYVKTYVKDRFQNTHVDHDTLDANVNSFIISPDGRTFDIDIDFVDRNDVCNLADTSTIRVTANEHMPPFTRLSSDAQPRVVKVENIGADKIKKENIDILVMVDLSESSKIIQRQHMYVEQIAQKFCRDNLFVTFMLPGGQQSDIMLATPYVIDSYITPTSPYLNEDITQPYPFLYRSVSNTLALMQTKTGTEMDNAKTKIMIILTCGTVYDPLTDEPIDPDHFQIQQKLIGQAQAVDPDILIYSVNMGGANGEQLTTDNNMLKLLSKRSGGEYYDEFSWPNIWDDIYQKLHLNLSDYMLQLSNPEDKVYLGSVRCIDISFYNKQDSLLHRLNATYRLGHVGKMFVTGVDDPVDFLLIRGIMVCLIVLAIIYILMQFLLPYINYRLFRHKYVPRYTGKGMSFRSMQIADTCYLCKAPFNVGDLIVARCRHVTHLECWNENGYQCPEHGLRCTEGAHFYDTHTLSNPRNANFRMHWVIIAVLSVMISWWCIIYVPHEAIFESMCDYFETIMGTTIGEAQTIMSVRLLYLPVIGVYVCGWLTFCLTMLASHERPCAMPST